MIQTILQEQKNELSKPKIIHKISKPKKKFNNNSKLERIVIPELKNIDIPKIENIDIPKIIQNQNIAESLTNLATNKDFLNIVEFIFCLKCKKKTATIKPNVSITKNKRKIIKGKCAICSTNKSKFIK